MKRNMTRIFAVLAVCAIWSCSKDEGKSVEAISGTYQEEQLALTLNGKTLADRSVAVEVSNDTEAAITLKGLILGRPSVTVPCTVSEQGAQYTLEGSNSTEFSEVSASGKIVDDKLELSLKNSIKGEMVKKWVTNELPGIHIDLSTPNDSVFFNGMMLPNENFKIFVNYLFGEGYLKHYLGSVNLQAKGTIVAEYAAAGDKNWVNSPDDLVYFAVNEAHPDQLLVLPDLAALMGANKKMDLNAIMELLEKGIGINYKVLEDGSLIAYVDKTFMEPFLDMIMQLVIALPDEGIYELVKLYVPQFVSIIKTSETFEIGLHLYPEQA